MEWEVNVVRGYVQYVGKAEISSEEGYRIANKLGLIKMQTPRAEILTGRYHHSLMTMENDGGGWIIFMDKGTPEQDLDALTYWIENKGHGDPCSI